MANSDHLLAVLEEYCEDSDPRVRAAALHALVRDIYCRLAPLNLGGGLGGLCSVGELLSP